MFFDEIISEIDMTKTVSMCMCLTNKKLENWFSKTDMFVAGAIIEDRRGRESENLLRSEDNLYIVSVFRKFKKGSFLS